VSFQLIHKVAHQVSLPLSHIFNLSISNGIFPDSFIISKVVPIFKAGSPQDPGNYRGIALVDAFSKVFEKLVADRLVKFLVKENFIMLISMDQSRDAQLARLCSRFATMYLELSMSRK